MIFKSHFGLGQMDIKRVPGISCRKVFDGKVFAYIFPPVQARSPVDSGVDGILCRREIVGHHNSITYPQSGFAVAIWGGFGKSLDNKFAFDHSVQVKAFRVMEEIFGTVWVAIPITAIFGRIYDGLAFFFSN